MSNLAQKRKHKVARTGLAIALGLLIPIGLLAQVRESTNYKIQFDSLNTGGGLSTSSNYQIEDTVGEIATGRSTSTNFKLQAGYQQMNEVFLSLTPVSDVFTAPNIGGLTGGVANGQTVATATTDSLAGYELTIKASTSPAMQRDGGGATIADYGPSGVDPDYTFTVLASDSELGFTPEGVDIPDRFKDNGSACNTGALDTADRCWDGLSTSEKVIARRTSSNHPGGSATTLKFRVEIGSSAFQLEGTYTATSTVTLTAL